MPVGSKDVKSKYLILFFLLSHSFLFSQDTIVNKRGWIIKLAMPVNFPAAKAFDYVVDRVKCGIADGVNAHYTVFPKITSGKSIDVLRYCTIRTGKYASWLWSYGINFKQNAGRLNYSGYREGGLTYHYYEGQGYDFYKTYYLLPNIAFSNKYKIGRNSFILNGFNLSLDFKVAGYGYYEFKNYPGASSVFVQTYEEHWTYWPWRYYNIPSVRGSYSDISLNYELGFGFPLKNRWTLVPTLRTSVISLNQLFIGKYNCYSSFSRMHNEFYREIIFGMNVIPHFKQKTK